MIPLAVLFMFAYNLQVAGFLFLERLADFESVAVEPKSLRGNFGFNSRVTESAA